MAGGTSTLKVPTVEEIPAAAVSNTKSTPAENTPPTTANSLPEGVVATFADATFVAVGTSILGIPSERAKVAELAMQKGIEDALARGITDPDQTREIMKEWRIAALKKYDELVAKAIEEALANQQAEREAQAEEATKAEKL